MKNSLLLLLLLSCTVYAQDKESHNFETTFSYGVAYIDYGGSLEDEILDTGIPSLGSFYEINVDLVLSKNRHLGIGFARQQHSNYIDDGVIVSNLTGLILDNFKNIHQKDFFDIHFRKAFENKLEFTVGAFFFIDKFNSVDVQPINELPVFIISNEKNRADNFGLFGSLEYFYPIKEYLEIGVKSKLYISLNGVETVALLPSLRVNI